MSTRILVLACAILFTACAARNLESHEPIGESTKGPAPPRARLADTVDTQPDGGLDDVEPYLMGKSAGPCGMEPPIIAFDASSMEIAEPKIQELRQFATCLTTAAYEKASVVLVGYTDVMGTVPANLQLGLARAQVVMRQLMSSGVAPGRIVVASAGELQRPHAQWGLHAHRVEVLIARGGPPRPDEAPITRGIEAEGLIPRPRAAEAARPARAAPTARRPVRGAPSSNGGTVQPSQGR